MANGDRGGGGDLGGDGDGAEVRGSGWVRRWVGWRLTGAGGVGEQTDGGEKGAGDGLWALLITGVGFAVWADVNAGVELAHGLIVEEEEKRAEEVGEVGVGVEHAATENGGGVVDGEEGAGVRQVVEAPGGATAIGGVAFAHITLLVAQSVVDLGEFHEEDLFGFEREAINLLEDGKAIELAGKEVVLETDGEGGVVIIHEGGQVVQGADVLVPEVVAHHDAIGVVERAVWEPNQVMFGVEGAGESPDASGGGGEGVGGDAVVDGDGLTRELDIDIDLAIEHGLTQEGSAADAQLVVDAIASLLEEEGEHVAEDELFGVLLGGHGDLRRLEQPTATQEAVSDLLDRFLIATGADAIGAEVDASVELAHAGVVEVGSELVEEGFEFRVSLEQLLAEDGGRVVDGEEGEGVRQVEEAPGVDAAIGAVAFAQVAVACPQGLVDFIEVHDEHVFLFEAEAIALLEAADAILAAAVELALDAEGEGGVVGVHVSRQLRDGGDALFSQLLASHEGVGVVEWGGLEPDQVVAGIQALGQLKGAHRVSGQGGGGQTVVKREGRAGVLWIEVDLAAFQGCAHSRRAAQTGLIHHRVASILEQEHQHLAQQQLFGELFGAHRDARWGN